jgi:putative CocE/NonD family hydrolase
MNSKNVFLGLTLLFAELAGATSVISSSGVIITEKKVGVDSVMIAEQNVMVPMRDGVCLASDIYRLKDAPPSPVLISRTPYGKRQTPEVEYFVKNGYVVIIQDVRGRFASEGEYYPYVNETADGVDCFAWAAVQPWSDGNIGTFGGSYLGGTQWLPARESPPALKAMIPEVTFSDTYEGMAYQGGVKILHDLSGAARNIIPTDMRRRAEKGEKVTDIGVPELDAVLNTLPVADHPIMQGAKGFYPDRLNNQTAGPYWERMSPNAGYEGVMVPSLNISGWYDIFTWGTLQNYTNMKQRGGSALARNNQRLIMGPWSHINYSGNFPGRDFGKDASSDAIGLPDIKIRWYDRWLKGVESGIDKEAPVLIFVMGANKWRAEQDWPLPDTKYRPYYLHSNGQANALSGNGTLSESAPGNEPSDTYTYNPLNPVPTTGGQVLGVAMPGPFDQTAVEKREDVLVYSTPVLDEAIEVTGNIELRLYVSSSALDTDFTGKLTDVFPDGRSIILTDGILRARYRESTKEARLLEPGKVYELVINLWATSNMFLPGHRIRLEVSSSNFPRFNRNSNTGGDISKEKTGQYKPAVNRIYHSTEYPSRLILPVIERK